MLGMFHPDHRSIMALFGTLQDFAAAIGEKYDTVVKWRARNSIPSWRWGRLVEVAAERRLSVSIDNLARTQPARRGEAA